MLTITKDINVVSVGQRPVINLSQYDSDFTLVFNLYASTGAFTMPSGTTAQIQGTKTDGNGYSAAASVSGNTVTVTGHVQMTAAAGPNVYEIAIFNNNKRLSTINFILMVERAALDSDTVSSESVIKDLSNIPAAVEQAEAAADRAEEAARTLTIDTTLTQSGQAADAKVTGDEINDLKEDLSEIATTTRPVEMDLLTYPYDQGYLTAGGVFNPTTGGNAQKTTKAIPLPIGSYTVDFDGEVNQSSYTKVDYVRAIAVYDSTDTCTQYIQVAYLKNFEITEENSYVRINVQYTSATTYQLKQNASVTTSINNDVLIPTDTTLTEANKPANAKAVGDALKNINVGNYYMPYRRPVIAFNFDGEYNDNPTFKQLFDAHGKKCGYAPQYTTNFPYTSKETYLEWQNEGFEIMAHSSSAVGSQSTATDEEIRQIVRDSYTTLTGYGFDIHGFIALQGNAKDVAINEAQRFFDYASTLNNHSGSYSGDGAKSNLYFAQNPPYKLWRYSMQTSTLEQMKSAVDECYDTCGFVFFYGHANRSQLGNMTLENIDALLTYIETKGIPILTPYEAIKDFYTVRPQDIVS